MTFEEMQLIMQSVVIAQRETQAIVESNSRAVQAILDQAATDRLKREEEKAEHQAQMAELRHISQGLVNMLDSIDDDRPTILRKLNTIENKTDAIIERLNRD
jgi:soluble cytochrome b562